MTASGPKTSWSGSYSIPASARASSIGGTSRPSALALTVEERVAGDQEGLRSALRESCEDGLDLSFVSGAPNVQLPSDRAGGRLQITQLRVQFRAIRVHDHRDQGCCRDQLVQEIEMMDDGFPRVSGSC